MHLILTMKYALDKNIDVFCTDSYSKNPRICPTTETCFGTVAEMLIQYDKYEKYLTKAINDVLTFHCLAFVIFSE